jgi:hypothetical protein
MALKLLSGSSNSVNGELLIHASKNLPSLIIDCANAANPHSLFPEIDELKLAQMHVFELELLYKFRDVLLEVPSIAEKLKAKSIVVTTINHLFNYQDELENQNILQHAWELMKEIGKKHEIIIGITPESKWATRFQARG